MKRLKLFFACLLMAVLSIGQVWADSPATITFGDLNLTNQQQYTDPFDIDANVSITFAGGNNDGKYYTTGSGIRTYGGGTITINAGSYTITEAAFTWDGSYKPGADNANPTGYSTATEKWTGSASSIVLTRPSGSGHWRLKSVTVTYSTGGSTACATPTFSPAAGTYASSQNVTINCATDGAAIHYTTDGTDPTTSSPTYSTAIPVSTTTTIKALAAKNGMTNSTVASATYTIVSIAHAGTSEDPYTVADAHNAILVGGDLSNKYVSGIISQIDSYNSTYSSITYWISDDGSTTNQLEVYSGKGIGGANFSSINDLALKDIVVVKGTLKDFNSTHEFDKNNELVSLAKPAEPTVTLKQSETIVTELNVEATSVANQAIDIVCTNFANTISSVTAELYSESTCENKVTSDAWVTDIIVNGTKDQVTFNVADNADAARQVWLKVTASDGSNDAYAVLAISQAKFSLDYAELPFAFNGGRADIEDKDGMTQEGLDSDYTGDTNADTRLKFNTTGDVVTIKINADPGTLTYNIKGNSYSGSTFKVQQSVDGVDYSDVAAYTELTTDKLSESKTLAKTTRYVKFIYTAKVNGNVALGNIAISEYVAPTVCEAPTFTPEDGETFTESLDVVLASATPGATVYYTLDGSEPTTASSVFGEKITLTETTTINAIAVKDGLSNSSVASATFTKVVIINSYDIDFETNDLAPYVNWNFNNIALASTAITAHGGTYYGNTDGKGSASITTKAKYANPGTLTFYISKESNNTTASSWIAQVSEDGTAWTDVDPSFDAKGMAKGEWNKCEADLSAYTNVYVRIAYSGSTAIRAIDDISLEPAAAVKKPVISDEESFLTSAEVSITCGTTGATIYYTTDGSDPKSGSEYSSSFTLTETATVRAIANLGEDWSAEAESKTFTKISVVDVATALSASENDEVYVQGTITSITEVNLNFSNATYVISDMSAGLPQNEMIVYRGKYVDGADFTSADQIHIGDVVVVSGTIGIYNEKNQLAQGNQIETISAPAVAAPTFTPDGGGFMGETDVTIACTTENSTIYYTINGSNPTKSSDEYADAIHLVATTTIKAIAYVGDEPSMVVTKTFTHSAPMTVAAACAALDSEDPINNAAVSGIVYQVDNISGGKATYWISDDGTDAGDKLEVYNGSGLNGADFAANGIQIGDEVTVFGNLTIYKGTKEFAAGNRLLAFNRPVFAVTDVEVDETATVKVNKTVQLTANVLPVNATNKNVTWSVKAGSEAYADVSATGLVTGKAEGIAIIVVTTEDGGFTDECTVTVTPGPPANTDIITAEEIGVGTSYEAWSGKNGFGTSSVYAGNSMTGTGDHAGAIQLRYNTTASKQSGIVLTASNGLYLKNLSVTVNGDPANTLNVYAKATAYDGYSDLYSNDEATRGTLIGTVSATGEMTLVDGISYNDNYQYIGMRSANNALYLDDITITWGDAYVAPTKYSVTYAAGEGSGDAPAAVEYEEGETFLVAAADLFNAPEGKEFDKWNDGSNDYAPGDIYTVGTDDVVLTAIWKATAPAPDYETVRSGLEIDRYYTVCLPKKVTAIKGASFWTLNNKSQDGATAYLEEETNNLPFDAGKPFIIQATAEKLEVVYEGAATEDAGTNGALHGTLVYMDAAALAAAGSDVYMLFSNELRPVGDNNHLDANRAYVKLGELNAVAEAPQSAPGRRVRAMPMQPQVATGFEAAEANEAPRKVLINGELFIIRGEKMYDAKGQLVK